MWLHGNCINISQRDRPKVYVCSFCSNTRPGSRMQDGRNNALGLAPAISPMSSQTFQTFR